MHSKKKKIHENVALKNGAENWPKSMSNGTLYSRKIFRDISVNS